MTVIDEIAARRQRLTVEEGFTPEHEDRQDRGQIARAAAAYANHSSLPIEVRDAVARFGPPWPWPWADNQWKPAASQRRDLVTAGALIVAEIERRDRAAAKTPEERAGSPNTKKPRQP